MVKILAVDPSSTELGLYAEEWCTTLCADKKLSRPERLARLADQLADCLVENGPFDFVVYEEQFVRGNAATRALYGIVGLVEALAISSGAGVMSVPQSTLRKWAKGHVSKDVKFTPKELYAEVSKRYDPSMEVGMTEHEHDAAVIYWYIKNNGEYND